MTIIEKNKCLLTGETFKDGATLTLPLTYNSRCLKLGHTFGSPKSFAHNFLFVRHCKRCPAYVTGHIKIVDSERLSVTVDVGNNRPEAKKSE